MERHENTGTVTSCTLYADLYYVCMFVLTTNIYLNIMFLWVNTLNHKLVSHVYAVLISLFCQLLGFVAVICLILAVCRLIP